MSNVTAGMMVNARVIKVRAGQMNVEVEGNLRGRIHITESGNTDEK